LIQFQECLRLLPLVAILRGVRPEEAVPIGAALIDAGFRMIEVPLNSPDPIASIRLLADRFGDHALIGAGTVRDIESIMQVAAAGGRLIVSPHADRAVVATAKRLDLVALPGCFTPTEAFTMIDEGADGLKLFPAEAAPPAVLKALKAVLPADLPVFPVGGITPASMAGYRQAGAAGFGLGSALYKPGSSPDDVARNAATFVEAWKALNQST
jgi:2-dehydro-3-deoxyphosphogalactonate aldolase